MGNALSYENDTGGDSNKLYLGDDAPILNKYVNRFFKELPHDYANSDKVLKKKGLSSSAKNQLNELYKKPLQARACCLQQENVPVALPYVYPYKKDGGFICKNNNECKSDKCVDKKCVKADDENDNIKTAYSKIKVFEEGELPQMCGGIADKQGIFRFDNKNINVYPEVQKVATGKTYTANSDSRNTLCKPFMGTVDYHTNKSSGIGICDKVIEDRKLSKPNDELYQFYGDAINGEQQVGYIDKGNIHNYRTISRDSCNAYPECSCTNSMYIRTPVTGSDGTKLTKMQTYAVQQNGDHRCRDADGNAFVEQIELQNIEMCVNIANNIRALADGGSKINMNQTCQTEASVKKETNVNKMKGMDDEDEANDENEEEAATEAEKNANADKVAKAKDRLREQELKKTDEQIAAEKQAAEEEAARVEAAKEAAKQAELLAAKKAAEEEAKKREQERLAREAEEEAARKKAEEEAARKKAEEEAARKKAEEKPLTGPEI